MDGLSTKFWHISDVSPRLRRPAKGIGRSLIAFAETLQDRLGITLQAVLFLTCLRRKRNIIAARKHCGRHEQPCNEPYAAKSSGVENLQNSVHLLLQINANRLRT
jgi:hypothetical protein